MAYRSNTRVAWPLLCACLLSACGQTVGPLYHWGDYQGQVYERLKGGASPQEQIQVLERHRKRTDDHGLALPPGYHAHLAMIYGEAGQYELMKAHLQREKALFPESAVFMDFLLNNAGK